MRPKFRPKRLRLAAHTASTRSRRVLKKTAASRPAGSEFPANIFGVYASHETMRIQKIVDKFRAEVLKSKRSKSKRKPSSRELIVLGYWSDAITRIFRADLELSYLERMDHVVARRALRVFVKPELAAVWLTTPMRQLWGKPPVACQKVDVLQVLGRLEHGVFS